MLFSEHPATVCLSRPMSRRQAALTDYARIGIIRWHGGSRSDVEAFPNDARREAGYQLFQVQIGEDPSDWKPMPSVGLGVREIRIRQGSGAYRIIYLTTIGDVVHVLHAFQKKAQATAKRDIDLAKARLRQIR